MRKPLLRKRVLFFIIGALLAGYVARDPRLTNSLFNFIVNLVSSEAISVQE